MFKDKIIGYLLFIFVITVEIALMDLSRELPQTIYQAPVQDRLLYWINFGQPDEMELIHSHKKQQLKEVQIQEGMR